MKRSTDASQSTRFRSDRFFHSNGQWFFTTREGGTEGPFSNREAAQSALLAYLMQLGVKPDDVWSRTGDNH